MRQEAKRQRYGKEKISLREKTSPKINSNKKEIHQGSNTDVLKTYKREEKNKQGCPHAPGDTIHRGQIERTQLKRHSALHHVHLATLNYIPHIFLP